ncbi:hypothetical protein BST61_g7185 [Cercospora zeina]
MISGTYKMFAAYTAKSYRLTNLLEDLVDISQRSTMKVAVLAHEEDRSEHPTCAIHMGVGILLECLPGPP